MSSLKSIFEKANSRKVKVFLIFLLCSFLAWAISTLSEVYESRTTFEVTYTNLPDSLFYSQNTDRSISAKIKASGFQFLSYSLSPRSIQLDVQEVLEEDGAYFLTANSVKNQLESQLPNRISLLELEDPLYWTDLYVVDHKKIPILPKVELRLAQNHILDGPLEVKPDSVLLKGPKKEIKTINHLETESIQLSDVTSSFTENLKIKQLDSLVNVAVNFSEVKISGNVVRFSEKEFDVLINSVNVPEGYRLRMFPDHVQLRCKAGVERLKELNDSDFNVFVDYSSIVEDKYLYVQIENKPDGVFSVRFLKDRIEFVLEKI